MLGVWICDRVQSNMHVIEQSNLIKNSGRLVIIAGKKDEITSAVFSLRDA